MPCGAGQGGSHMGRSHTASASVWGGWAKGGARGVAREAWPGGSPGGVARGHGHGERGKGAWQGGSVPEGRGHEAWPGRRGQGAGPGTTPGGGSHLGPSRTAYRC